MKGTNCKYISTSKIWHGANLLNTNEYYYVKKSNYLLILYFKFIGIQARTNWDNIAV